MRSIALLGSTGSIGVSTLDLVRRFTDRFRIFGMVAGQNLKLLASQIKEFAPQCVAIKNESDVPRLRKLLGKETIEIGWGVKGAAAISTANEVDVVLAAIVGAAGLVPTLQAIRAGKEIALANKEALVMAGEILVNEASKSNSRLFPVDSEHSAIFQCLEGNQRDEVDKLILTASGGPFLKTPLSRLSSVTISQALKHPNWKMGQKITIDSATMMNKGLEVVEAHWEFNMEPSRIDVVIHPQSVVHSMVRYQDGTIIAQLGIPDMRIPIAYALAYPHRLDGGWKPLDVTDHRELNFLPVDKKRYPALDLAYDALKQGGTMPAVLNAANEIAVEAFLAGKIGFREIHRTIESTMCGHLPQAVRDVEDVLDADRWARERATSLVR